jgi:guanidinopropionase
MVNVTKFQKIKKNKMKMIHRSFSNVGGLLNPTHPRYSGVRTLLRAPYESDLNKVDVGLVGVPFDGGVTNRPGARYGPNEVRNNSDLVRSINQATKVSPHFIENLKVRDVGDAVVTAPFRLEESHLEIEQAFKRLCEHSVFPLAVGGDHSVSLPILRALRNHFKETWPPFGLIHIDAHADTGENYGGSKFHHGAPFSRAVEEGLIDPKRTIQIGIRGSIADKDQWKFSHDSGMRVVYMEEFFEMTRDGSIDRVTNEIANVVGSDIPCYLSMDIDVLDPCYAPGTGTPEIGGMTTLEAQLLIRSLGNLIQEGRVRGLVGADLVEVSPPFDSSSKLTSMTGAMLLFEILCAVVGGVVVC